MMQPGKFPSTALFFIALGGEKATRLIGESSYLEALRFPKIETQIV